MACCRRAVSGAYYALFHCVARESADLLIGGYSANRSQEAWPQVYRALEHAACKERCKNKDMVKRFPKGIEDFAGMFVTLQDQRHAADYDPFATFSKSSVEADIILAGQAIKDFKAESIKDRRAFCAYVLFKRRT
jgi:uncharacterized protein (UPF0332 family)